VQGWPPRNKRGRTRQMRKTEDTEDEDQPVGAASIDLKDGDTQAQKKKQASLEKEKLGAKGDKKEASKHYEYKDHTADVQLHTWGSTLQEAFEWQVVAMFGYMTDLELVEEAEEATRTFEAEGHDIDSLLYNFLNEALMLFAEGELFVAKRVQITEMRTQGSDQRIVAKAFGETFDRRKHTQGTEVKAITYSNMQILETPAKDGKPARWDVYVIIDI